MKIIFVIIEIFCIPTGTGSALRKNRSMRVPVDSLAPWTRFGSAIRVGPGSGCDTLSLQLSLSLPFLSFSFFFFLWITLNHIFKGGNFLPLSYMPHAFSLIFLPFSLFLYSLSLHFCSYKDKTKLGLIPFLF